MWSSIWIKRLPGHSLHTGEAVPGPAGEKGGQAAEGAATTGPQGALEPGHLGAAHQGGAEEAGGGTAGGGEEADHKIYSNYFSFIIFLLRVIAYVYWLTFCFIQDEAFCAKVHGKLNKVSTASAAAAESLDDNHLRLMLVNGRIIRWELASLRSSY